MTQELPIDEHVIDVLLDQATSLLAPHTMTPSVDDLNAAILRCAAAFISPEFEPDIAITRDTYELARHAAEAITRLEHAR